MSVAELKAEIQKLTREEKKELQDALEVAIAGQSKDSKGSGEFDATARSIWEIAKEIRKSVPQEEWQKLPKDGSINVDHYLYGHPKVW